MNSYRRCDHVMCWGLAHGRVQVQWDTLDTQVTYYYCPEHLNDALHRLQSDEQVLSAKHGRWGR
jgi:hypothetical protein